MGQRSSSPKKRSVCGLYLVTENALARLSVRQTELHTCDYQTTARPTSRLFTLLVTQRIAIWPHPVTELDHRGSSYSHRIMKLSNLSWRYRRTLEYLKPTSYTPSVPFLFLFIANKISSASILSTTRHYPHYRFQGIRPQPLHSFIGSPLALGDRRQRTSTVASPHIEEWEATVDLPYPAVKCVITQVTHASPDQRCWAVLVLGAFYDANDRILWQTEIFLGDKAEDSEETYEDSYSVSDTEEGMLREHPTISG